MNIKTYFSLLAATSLLVVSCKKDLEPQESSEAVVATDVVSTELAVPQADQQQMQQQMQQMPQQTTMPNTATAQPAQSGAKGLNPAHGQPGHRCEIPVGAPLNSAPAAAKAAGNKPTMMSNNPSTKITPAQVNADGMITPANSGAPAILNPGTATAPGMNPPHGQAGHRCDIAVGQPLP